jgi:predicted ATPase
VLSLAPPEEPIAASIECGLNLRPWLHYELFLSGPSPNLGISHERLETPERGFFERGWGIVHFAESHNGAGGDDIPVNQSVLAYRIPGDPTPITEVGRSFERIRIYREFRTSGPFSAARNGVSPSVMKDFLHDGGDNLAVVLHDLDFQGAHAPIQSYLRRFCERFEDVKTRLTGPIMGAYMQENGLREPISATRLSDGTLKFLCLLAVLLKPDIPPLICIEEPEVGLHPDAIKIVAEALVEASERTQLIVTTHSEALIDALSQRPEDVLVCERDFDNGTQFRRLDRDQLSTWLERYTLGALSRKGELGGTRW